MFRAAGMAARRLGAPALLMICGCAQGNADGELERNAAPRERDSSVDACVETACGDDERWSADACGCEPSCAGDACSAVGGSCNPEFCPPATDGVTCCYTPNGPCGQDLGFGCGQPLPNGACNPKFCPTSRRGVPCCVAPAGPCGVDEGAGCVGDAPSTSDAGP